jgi:hypothetical protein
MYQNHILKAETMQNFFAPKENLARDTETVANVVLQGQRGGTLNFKIEPSFMGSLHSFIFLE